MDSDCVATAATAATILPGITVARGSEGMVCIEPGPALEASFGDDGGDFFCSNAAS
jgi:hypothetical protein